MNPVRTSLLLPLVLLLLLLLLPLAGCSEDEHAHDDEDLDAEICEHMADGPSQAVVAPADPTAQLPDVSVAHTRFDLALADDGNGGFLGHVSYPVGEAGDTIVAVDRAVTVSALDTAGAVIAAETTVANPDCASTTHHLLELPIGTATLVFASPDQDQVRVVIEAAAHAAEE